MTHLQVEPGRIGRLFPLPFVVIVVLFIASNLAALYKGHVVYQRTRDVVDDALVADELLARMRHDMDRERLLIDEHVYQKESFGWFEVEKRIREVQSDFLAAARDYESLASTPGRQAAWRSVQGEVHALRPPMAQALVYSRANLDELARESMHGLNQRFVAIDRYMSDMIALNRQAATEARAQIGSVQRSSTLLLGVLGLAGIVTALGVAGWVLRLVRRSEGSLHGYAAALEVRNRELDAFAGRVAHDIKGPLSIVKMAGSQLQRRAPGDEKSSALLNRGLARMAVLIDDLLALSRVGDAKGLCDPSEAVRQVEEDFGVQHASGRLRVAVESAQVTCKQELLREAIWNLVENAVKYRRPEAEPEIELAGRTVESEYQLSIVDNGLGMSQADAGHVFEPFFRAATTRDRPGTGLGLSIVKRVAESAGGRVSMTSTPGLGTTVVLRLPLRAADQGA